MLHWPARRRAEQIISTLYSPAQQWTVSPEFAGLPLESHSDGIVAPQRSNDELPDNLTSEHATVALTYLLVCWDKSVLDRIVAGTSIPDEVLKAARRLSSEVHERIQLAGRIRHVWSGRDLSADTRALGETIVGTTNDLYRVDYTLMRVVKGAAATGNVGKIHRAAGNPGATDHTDFASHRLMPMHSSDTEALRELIAEHVAAEFPMNSKSTAEGVSRFGSFGSNRRQRSISSPMRLF
jgi:hypothetical protein